MSPLERLGIPCDMCSHVYATSRRSISRLAMDDIHSRGKLGLPGSIIG
jgi:hypothetical protein